MASRDKHDRMANAIRFLSMDAVEKANSGHPGLPMGCADIATVLFTRYLKFDPKNPKWADRDRFVLSAGHGSMLLYSVLYLTGYADMTLGEIERFISADRGEPPDIADSAPVRVRSDEKMPDVEGVAEKKPPPETGGDWWAGRESRARWDMS